MAGVDTGAVRDGDPDCRPSPDVGGWPTFGEHAAGSSVVVPSVCELGGCTAYDLCAASNICDATVVVGG